MSLLSLLIAALLGIPAMLALVWFAEILLGCIGMLTLGKASAPSLRAFRTAVLIPAHNEGTGLIATIRDAQAQLRPGDRILVVADNCTDDTAHCARSTGVDVVERFDPERCGKGYALQFGMKELAKSPPDIVVVVDADCRLGPDALMILAGGAFGSGRPAQALYLMQAPEAVAVKLQAAEFAYRIRNWLRPLGMRLVGLPSPLFGTGMAFPFKLVSERSLGNARLAEDTALGLDLAIDRHAAQFYPQAKVTSTFPLSAGAAETQRMRWEQGNLQNIRDIVFKTFLSSVRKGNVDLIALSLDQVVPPLSLLAMSVLASAAVGAVASALGVSAAVLALPAGGLAFLLAGATLAWLVAGRDLIPASQLSVLPLYVIGKFGFYRTLAARKAPSTWIRTDRS